MNGASARLGPPPLPAPALLPDAGLAWLGVCLLLWLLAYMPTFRSMADIWLRSPTFAHGIVIAPLSAWLVWRQRAVLAAVPRRSWPPGLALVAALGLAWLLAAAACVQVLQQYAATAMAAAIVAAVQGPALARALAFPLGYLLLAVPCGEFLVPPLIEFTARFTVAALQLCGIPVFRDNNYILLPGSSWSVVEACSGLRYLIASCTLSSLYAYLNYRSLRKRLAFMAVGLVLPILANGVRAWAVILLGHASGLRLAAGVDHLLYGWLFFGLLSLLLFWGGALFRDMPGPATVPAPALPTPANAAHAGAGSALAALAVCGCWPLVALALPEPAQGLALARTGLALPTPPLPWRVTAVQPGDGMAAASGQTHQLRQAYTGRGARVLLQLDWFARLDKRTRLLAQPAVEGSGWSPLYSQVRQVPTRIRSLEVRETMLQAGTAKLLRWQWCRLGSAETAIPWQARLLQARARLLGGPGVAAVITLDSAYDDDASRPAAAMAGLLDAMLPAIDQELRHAAP
ncbi:exosortase A [Oxalobacteraceae bacterium A2-2]